MRVSGVGGFAEDSLERENRVVSKKGRPFSQTELTSA